MRLLKNPRVILPRHCYRSLKLFLGNDLKYLLIFVFYLSFFMVFSQCSRNDRITLICEVFIFYLL